MSKLHFFNVRFDGLYLLEREDAEGAGWLRFFEDKTVAMVSTVTKDVQEALAKIAAGKLDFDAKGTYRVTGTTLECAFPATDWNGKPSPTTYKGAIGPNTLSLQMKSFVEYTTIPLRYKFVPLQ